MRGELLGWVVSGGVAAAGIKLIESVLLWLLHRRAKAHDDRHVAQEERHAQAHAQMEDIALAVRRLQSGQRVLLHDRLKTLCCQHLEAGVLAYDDRRDLIAMHGIYHHDLGGNGSLDRLVSDASALPLSKTP